MTFSLDAELQLVKSSLPFTLCDDELFQEMQCELSHGYGGLTRKRASTEVLPAMVTLANMIIASEHANDQPVCLMVDGAAKKNGFRFEAFMSEPLSFHSRTFFTHCICSHLATTTGGGQNTLLCRSFGSGADELRVGHRRKFGNIGARAFHPIRIAGV